MILPWIFHHVCSKPTLGALHAACGTTGRYVLHLTNNILRCTEVCPYVSKQVWARCQRTKLQKKICLVTGASRGVGKGIAIGLGEKVPSILWQSLCFVLLSMQICGKKEHKTNRILIRKKRAKTKNISNAVPVWRCKACESSPGSFRWW